MYQNWDSCERIEFRHTQVKLGDLFDYYTTNGEFSFPPWVQFKYVVRIICRTIRNLSITRALDEPTSGLEVQAFIEVKGIDRLEGVEKTTDSIS
ncbi:hypothetical protein P3T76_010655 [Phytophthora citrophthora]|uniref:Uncharacterized protein n=1 Tax=Phytophthora citrophthora TaxID=4793 RepID=A0AAD9GBR7_9STRA|nr:hypothetical protein P3T76_010655 [Phytophthora citrophthora]